jgi:hypothetical protein
MRNRRDRERERERERERVKLRVDVLANIETKFEVKIKFLNRKKNIVKLRFMCF